MSGEPRRVELGVDGLSVGAMGLGCMGMSEFYGERDDEESERTVRRALDLGLDMLDTADVYGLGENERLVGRALRGRRDEAVIATKFGLVRDGAGRWAGVCGRPEYVRERCEASLAALGVETIDLYYQHRVDPLVPIEETVGAMKELVESGKVRALGLSEAGPETVRRAHAVHPISAYQGEYSLWTRDLEETVLPVCGELGIVFVAYSPLGRGMLTATIRSSEEFPECDYRRGTPRFQAEHFEANLRLAETVGELAAMKGCTAAQLALAWVLAKGVGEAGAAEGGPAVVPIPGTKRVSYLEQNAGALGVMLSPGDVSTIEGRFPLESSASGSRYPLSRMGELGR